MTPRPYQLDCIAKIFEAFKEFQRILVILATGGGKSFIFSLVTQEFVKSNLRVLILANTKELVEQPIFELHQATGIFAQKEKAESKASRNASVVVGSIQTMQGPRLAAWPQNHFDLIVVDECDLSMAKTWQNILSYFSSAKVLGVTATPNRTDRKSLMDFFQVIAFQRNLFDLIHDGYLVPIVRRSFPLKIDLSGVQMSGMDYEAESLGKTLEPYLPLIARGIRERAPFGRILIFCPLIATSQKMASVMRDEGFACEHVDGKSDERAAILKRFESGETEAVCNANLLGRGYNNPAIDTIMILSLTQSDTLYEQRVGRGTRLHEGKSKLLLLDPLWQHGRRKLCSPCNLISTNDDEAEEMEEVSTAHYCDREVNLEALMLDTVARREKKLADELEKNRRRREREEKLLQEAKDVAQTQMLAPDAPISQKQMRLIISFGYNPAGMTKKQANEIIGRKFQQQRKAA